MFSWLIPRCVSLRISLYLTIFPPNVEMAGSALASRPHRRRRGRCARRSSVRIDGRWMSAPMSRGITHRIARNNHPGQCAADRTLILHGEGVFPGSPTTTSWLRRSYRLYAERVSGSLLPCLEVFVFEVHQCFKRVVFPKDRTPSSTIGKMFTSLALWGGLFAQFTYDVLRSWAVQQGSELRICGKVLSKAAQTGIEIHIAGQ